MWLIFIFVVISFISAGYYFIQKKKYAKTNSNFQFANSLSPQKPENTKYELNSKSIHKITSENEIQQVINKQVESTEVSQIESKNKDENSINLIASEEKTQDSKINSEIGMDKDTSATPVQISLKEESNLVEKESSELILERTESTISEKEQSKKSVGRNFNFKTSKNKIESLLKKDSILSNQESGTLSEINIINEPLTELNVNSSANLEENTNEKSIETPIPIKESVTTNQTSSTSDLPSKSKGFNFKNPKLKQTSSTPNTKENDAVNLVKSEVLPQTSEVKKETVEEIKPEKTEEKRPKGFNFRNNQKVKVE